LAGLDPPDATELVVDHLGREFGSAEKEQVLALAAQLQGHPGRLIDAARAVREGTATFEGLLAESTAAAAAAAGRTRLSGFTPGERKIVELLAAFKASGLDRSHIEALVGEEAAQALRDLVTKRVVVSSSPRYRLDATSIGEVIEETDLQRNRVRATEHFVQWAATADPDDLARSAPELLHSLESARLDHDWPTVLALGTALEAPLAATRRWGAWASVLEAIIEGARRLGDTAAEAKALHQLGTRALLRGDRRVARSLLREARRTSKRLGDQAGAALSGHNLSLAGPWWLAPWVVVVAILGGLAGAVATVCVVSEVCVGAVAMIEAEPTELAFREVSLRQGRTERVILANTSDASERVGPASIEGDDAFQVVTEDCPEVLRPAGVCALVVSFTPDEPGDYAGTLVVPLAGGDPIRVPLSGNALTPGELRAMPERVDFGSVFEGRAEERVLTVTNVGEETAMLSQPPAVDGRYFTLGANDCLDSVEPHASCEITVVFEPKRIGDQGVQGGVASGTLTIGWDQDGHAVIPIEGVSIALPDLAIELTEAEPIGRTLLFGPPGGLAQFSTDVVVIRVIAGVGNTGLVAAGEFLIAAEWFSEEQGQWLPAQLGAEPATASDHVAFVGSEPESSAEFRGFVVIPRGLLDPALPLRIRLIVDHCEGVAAEAAECDIVEADEANNVSVEVEANPVVAISTVPLQVSQHRLLSQETNSADLVADALLDYARRLAEEQGLEAPTAAILDVPSMLPPGRPPELFLIGDAFVGPRDLRVLHLVDLVPVGEPVLLLEAEWEAVIARFLNAVTGGVPSDRFLQISAGSLFEWCANEDTAIAILTLGGDQLIPAESNSPLILATTRTLAEEIGGKQIGEPVTLAEILRDYIVGVLGGEITADDYPLESTDRIVERESCVVIL